MLESIDVKEDMICFDLYTCYGVELMELGRGFLYKIAVYMLVEGCEEF